MGEDFFLSRCEVKNITLLLPLKNGGKCNACLHKNTLCNAQFPTRQTFPFFFSSLLAGWHHLSGLSHPPVQSY